MKTFLKRIAISALILTSTLVPPVSRVSAAESYEKISGSPAPHVSLGQIVTLTYIAKNISGVSLNTKCLFFIANPAWSYPTTSYLEYVSASATSPSGSTTTAEYTTTNGNTGVVISPITVSNQEQITCTFKFKVIDDTEFPGRDNILFDTTVEISQADTNNSVLWLTGIYIEPAQEQVTPPTEPPTEPPSQPTPEPEPEPEPAPISSIVLPDNFTQEGSSTTDISQLTLEESKAVENFTLEDTSTGKIVFTQPLDLSSEELVGYFENLGEYVDICNMLVKVDAGTIPVFNTGANITLYNLDLKEDALVVLMNDTPADDSVSSLTYDSEQKTLTFSVKDFANSYSLSPNLVISEETTSLSEVSTEEVDISGSVADRGATIELLLNGEEHTGDIVVDEEGKFTVRITLQKGENEIKVRATSAFCSITDEEVFKLTYKPDNSLLLLIILILFLLLVSLIVLGYIAKKKGWLRKLLKKSLKEEGKINSINQES